MAIKSLLVLPVLLLTVFAAGCTEKDMQEQTASLEPGVSTGEQASDRVEAGLTREEERNPDAGSGNRLPELTVAKLVADIEQDRSILRAVASAVDEDDDEISFTYQWERNGSIVDENGDVLRDFKRGDTIVLTISPFDGKEYGRSVTLRTEIANTPPVIVRDDDFSFDGQNFTKQIRAEDADGDQLVFSLVKGPEGMKIDPSSGVLSWTVPSDLKSAISATIEVVDGQGAKVSYNIEIPITMEEEKEQQ